MDILLYTQKSLFIMNKVYKFKIFKKTTKFIFCYPTEKLVLRITRGQMNKTATCILVSCLSFLSAANAKTMYTYTSSTGDILLTDKKQDSKAFRTVNITKFPDSNIHTYSNWGNSIASAAKGFENNKSIYDAHIVRAASKFNIDPGLIKAVMHTE